ncbi:hypothetical protein GGTG_12494 [Gaeumannomyces tritici R3-111a-1]|uniref:Uncharacterized protein n=1 Tax=Gaeumannomyces tritici (strain R3-111a-1) TaxID=644352 RepID=J3PG68_GAET3|nr:hypothetical protein GGTG_12494 [Gaeumannomyces tritici R3-111a-1]EJT70322.1 hypothetical protein GGTG_12494 [Gaeumannomyces tritici R3-111a-1]
MRRKSGGAGRAAVAAVKGRRPSEAGDRYLAVEPRQAGTPSGLANAGAVGDSAAAWDAVVPEANDLVRNSRRLRRRHFLTWWSGSSDTVPLLPIIPGSNKHPVALSPCAPPPTVPSDGTYRRDPSWFPPSSPRRYSHEVRLRERGNRILAAQREPKWPRNNPAVQTGFVRRLAATRAVGPASDTGRAITGRRPYQGGSRTAQGSRVREAKTRSITSSRSVPHQPGQQGFTQANVGRKQGEMDGYGDARHRKQIGSQVRSRVNQDIQFAPTTPVRRGRYALAGGASCRRSVIAVPDNDRPKTCRAERSRDLRA